MLVDPSNSFIVELSQEELQAITIKEFLIKADNIYISKHQNYNIGKVQNQIEISINQDGLLIESHFNLFPFYFFPKKHMFQIDVNFQDQTYHFQLPINTTQKSLIEQLSKQLELDANLLYLQNDSQALKNELSSYSSVKLYVYPHKIFYDDQEINVDLNLKSKRQYQIYELH